jgi:hypothetical protein
LRRGLPVVALLIAAGVLIASLATAEVLERGALLPYTPMTVERVRVLGGVDLWIAVESLTRLDVVNALILGAGSVLAVATALRLRGRPGQHIARLVVLFALLAAGFAFLAVDEFVAVHETVGYNLDFLAELPGVKSPEDVVFALYAVPSLAFFYGFRNHLAASHWGVRLVAVGVALFILAAGLDVADALLDEQWVEPLASLALVAGFELIGLRHLALTGAAGATPPAHGIHHARLR